MAPPVWQPRKAARGYGVPTGCLLELPIQEANFPAPGVRFIATRSALDELAIALANGRDAGFRASAAWFRLSAGQAADFPWNELDAPPLVARAESGWVAAFADTRQTSATSAFFWRGHGSPEELARGDQMTVADVLCHRDICAVLTTVPRQTIVPGASVFIGRASEPADQWQRVDIEPDFEHAWRPFSLVKLAADGQSGTLSLASSDTVALWSWRGAKLHKDAEQPAPFGVYDVVNASIPLLVAPAARTDTPCTEDSFPLSVGRFGRTPARVQGQALPQSVIARPLANGAIVVWVAPVSCRIKTRSIVHAVVVRADGTPAGATMSVADATGFAVATDGDRVSLWLRKEHGVTWLRATCSALPPT